MAETTKNSSFEHNSKDKNTKVGETSTKEKINLKLDFEPNILDSYDVATYHFKFFITDLATASSGTVFDTNKQIIIAETGVTDLTIDKVEVTEITTPSSGAGTGTSTGVKFEVFEPGGAGMVDKLFYQSIALGVGNWSVMPFYLQLSFKTRDPEYSEVEGYVNGNLPSKKWIWPLKISNIKTTVTGAGTQYDFEAIIYNDFGLTNSVASLTQSVKLKDLKTFGDAMVKLEDHLNISARFRNYDTPDVYRIIVDPAISGELITPADKVKNPRRNDDYAEFENKDATFLPGTTIDKIIDSLLSQTKKYQAELTSSTTAGGTEKTATESKEQMKKFWRIICQTKPIAFDPIRVDLANEFIIYVVEYDLGALNTSMERTATPETYKVDRKRVLEYVNKSILKKKYNYIFTGLNDQIVSFDLVINCAFAQANARYGGIYLNSSTSDIGVQNHKTKQEELELYKSIKKAGEFLHNPKTADTEFAEKAVQEATKKIKDSSLSDEKKKEYLSLLAKQKAITKLTNSTLSAADQNMATNIEKLVKDVKYLADSNEDNSTGKNYRFISDIDITSKKSIETYRKILKDSSGSLRPIAQRETLQDKQVGSGVESNSDSGAQKISTMFSVALHAGGDGSFQKIDLVIKGDPYWLFPEPFTDENASIHYSDLGTDGAIKKIKKLHKAQTDTANLLGTDNFILVRFRTPKIYSSTNGDRNYDENDNSPDVDIQTYSGVYKVVEIKSNFAKGKFTQDLSCILDPYISMVNIEDIIEENIKQLDNVPEYRTVENGQNLPIKDQKLLGPVAEVPTVPGTELSPEVESLLKRFPPPITSVEQPGYSPQPLQQTFLQNIGVSSMSTPATPATTSNVGAVINDLITSQRRAR